MTNAPPPERSRRNGTPAQISFPRPSAEVIARALRVLTPWRSLTNPHFEGMANVPDTRPLLFVGNHTLFGLLDVPLLFAELYEKKGIYLRGLGDHVHFKVPYWGDILTRFGAVDGTRENCAALMDAGETVLVFPGGAREVAKRKGEQYKLFWKDRLGFAKMAIRHACTVVPFAAVGGDDAYEIVMDGDELLGTPVGRLLKELGLRTDIVLPLAKGFAGTPLPRPDRFYFHIGEPITTFDYGRDDRDEAARDLRERTRAAVEAGIASLLERRANDPKHNFVDRLFDVVVHGRSRLG